MLVGQKISLHGVQFCNYIIHVCHCIKEILRRDIFILPAPKKKNRTGQKYQADREVGGKIGDAMVDNTGH